VPARKSDVTDTVRLTDLLAHALVRGRFVPPAPIQALRDLRRTRKQLVRQAAQHTLRLQQAAWAAVKVKQSDFAIAPTSSAASPAASKPSATTSAVRPAA
jgi:hypothetical protein